MEHPSDDLLEIYSMRRLADSENAQLEEHLLICEECRNRLESTDFDIVSSLKTRRSRQTLDGFGRMVNAETGAG